MLTATVSGSFHRHMHEIYRTVQDLRELGVCLLSPADPRVVDQLDDFLFVASDRLRSVRLVQDRHLECVAASDFLWLVAPDGYVGQSASMEIGFAVANNVPIFGQTCPTDLTLRQYLHKVDSLESAVAAATTQAHTKQRMRRFLIDPHAGLEEAAGALDRIAKSMHGGPGDAYLAEAISADRRRLVEIFGGVHS